jgi:hypothetical protein
LRSVRIPLLALVAAVACAHAPCEPSGRREQVRVDGAVFHLRYEDEDVRAAAQVKEALRKAVPAAERWGRLSGTIVVTIHPTHEALEAAARQRGYPWLRAWTRYGSVDLQSPRTWSHGNATDAEMAQLLVHELTHCVMYQSTASASTWRSLRIPLWFREGMATVTAGERKRIGRAEIRRFYREATAVPASAGDPVSAPEPLYRSQSDLVYGAAQSAFQFLIDRYGEERIRALLADMARGADFDSAFCQAVGIPVDAFEREFKRYVLWDGALARGARGT